MAPSPESQREPLSRSVEDYLKAIHRLSAEGRPASTTQIAEALAVASRVRLFTRATSLGGVESLIEHRASMEGPLSQTPPNLIRLSIGLENVDDLVADLEQALGS